MLSRSTQTAFTIQLGDALLDRSVESALCALWEGGLSPSKLSAIELGIRAFITSKRLLAPPHGDRTDGIFGFVNSYHPPFDETVLQYEFVNPERDVPLPNLDAPESAYLLAMIDKAQRVDASALVREGRTMSVFEAMYTLKNLYQNYPIPFDTDLIATIKDYQRDFEEEAVESRFEHQTYSVEHVDKVARHVAKEVHRDEASYFIKCHRAGLIVYTDSKVGRICNDFIFAEWPRKLFEKFDSAYEKSVRSLRAPGISIELPPMIAMVLYRARNRSHVPEVLREMRDEYKEVRSELWSLICQAWFAPTYKEQLKHLRQLQLAADSLHDAAFPERIDILSLGLGVASMSLKDVAGKLREHDQPSSRVASVSFAAKFAKDLQKYLGNQSQILKRHLSASERIEFGVGP